MLEILFTWPENYDYEYNASINATSSCNMRLYISLCVCVCPCLSIHIPHKFMRYALFASFVVSHFQVFPYQSMHRLLIISRRHSCKIFVRISSQVQSMRIGSTKCGSHTHLFACVCVFFIISKSLLDCCYLKFYWKIYNYILCIFQFSIFNFNSIFIDLSGCRKHRTILAQWIRRGAYDQSGKADNNPGEHGEERRNNKTRNYMYKKLYLVRNIYFCEYYIKNWLPSTQSELVNGKSEVTYRSVAFEKLPLPTTGGNVTGA